MTTYSTMSLIFNPQNFIYYLNEEGRFEEVKKEKYVDVGFLNYKPFFCDDLYANNEFFQLFSEHIISFDELHNLNQTAYVKKINNKNYPFFIGFNPLFFLIKYAYPTDDGDQNIKKDNDIKELIRNSIFSSRLIYKNISREKKEEIVQHFIQSYENKKWTYYGWLYWNDILFKNVNLARFITRVFIHEMYHILFGHLDEKLYGSGKYKHRTTLNIAEDFVINSNIYWRNDFSVYNNTFISNYFFIYENVPEYFSENSCMKSNYNLLFKFIKAYIKYIIDGKLSDEVSYKQTQKFQELYERVLEREKNKDPITYNEIIQYASLADKIYDKFSSQLGIEKGVNSTEFYYYILVNLNDFSDEMKFMLIDHHDNHLDGERDGESKEDDGDEGSQEKEVLEIDENISDKVKEIAENILNKINNKNKNFDKNIPAIQQKVINDIFENRNIPFRVSTDGLSVHKWKRKLQKFILYDVKEAQYNYDVTFKKENRRVENLYVNYIPSDNYDFILVVDVSPSINDDDYKEFVNEIKKIGKQLNIHKVRLIEFNSNIVLDKKIIMNNIDQFIPKTMNSSTDLQCVFNELKNTNNKKPVLVFTDGYFPYFNPLAYDFKHLLYISCSLEQIKRIDNLMETLKQYNFNVISKFD